MGPQTFTSKTAASDPQNSPCRNHAVYFYDQDLDMCVAVAEFVAAGLRCQEPIILVTTLPHRQEISRLLLAHKLDIKSAHITWMDAGTTLEMFMKNGAPDGELFMNSVGNLVQQTQNCHRDKPLRIFGEMVDVLVRGKNDQGAIELERLWNDLGRVHGFSLLCAYAVGKFYRQEHWRHFQMICDQHAEFSGGMVSSLK